MDGIINVRGDRQLIECKYIMYEAREKGYHQKDHGHRIVPVIGATLLHSRIAEGIFKQRNDFCKAGKEIKQIAKPETKIAV